MFRMLTFIILFGYVSSATEPAHADTPGSADAAQWLQHVTARIQEDDKTACKDESALACLGISESTCRAAKADVFEMCTKPLLQKLHTLDLEDAADSEMKMAKCAFDLAVEKHDIDPDKYMRCVAQYANDDSDAIMKLLRNR